MTDIVFLSGSIAINRLNDKIRERLSNIVTQKLDVIIGDAGGADKAMQSYFAEKHYDQVEVFCVGGECRNNVGNWKVRHVPAPPNLKGRELFMEKDRAMAAEADYGFVLWDGKSPGSLNNIISTLEGEKPVVVYFAPEEQFHTLKRAGDVRTLLGHCSEADKLAISRKLHVDRRLEKIGGVPQGSLSF